MKILVTDKTELHFPTPDDTVVVSFKESRPIPEEHLDADIVVCWGATASLGSMVQMPNLKWIQSLSAGTDAFLAAGLPESVLLTSGRGLHDHTVTEHAVALLLALVRELPDLVRAQDEHRWASEKRGPKPMYLPERVSTLIDARVLIWGFGSIGQTLAPALTALGCSVRGVARSAGERAGYPVIATDDIREALPDTDILVMILPSEPATFKALNAELLSLLPDRSLVCNVGRGSTVDEEALVAALRDGRIAGAALDVMQTEPLPADSPLWDAPNCLLTPHVAGFRAHGGDELMGGNLAAFLAGEPLRNLVER
ncbi:NAD(P)-dependent oxidoreductase [Tessaracoccus caeni]|uniref:NAD(P)-dependent oxidoreductase n=1 Tax=Tessaracoccus caeni TaxID=3031239 RepID=UPI0023DA6451|nr:NAD(P)-dependent oxidoreductase [Tessaracoccus caeni]MDF1487709.1 NAD(P)-dependent oxidoreductase [Tessaracoccus caeni]